MSLPDNIVPGSVRAKVAVIGMVTILLTLALRLYTFFILNLNEFEISNVHKHYNLKKINDISCFQTRGRCDYHADMCLNVNYFSIFFMC